MTLTVVFSLDRSDKATQLVQNRVAQAEPRLPRTSGVSALPRSRARRPHDGGPLALANDRYDMTYLRNYALLNVKDRLARIDGVGQVLMWARATTRCACGSIRRRSLSAAFPRPMW